MYCTKCGHPLAAGDKFCSGCGEKVVLDENKVEAAASAIDTTPAVDKFSLSIDDNEPLFEPFDFKAFGFDFENLGLGVGVSRDEETGIPEVATEEFNWNTSAFPDRNVSKTEDVDFNWSLTGDEPAKQKPAVKPEPVTEPVAEAPAVEIPDTLEKEEPSELEKELFGDLNSKTDETRKQAEEIDKFFTFHQKNEEFQKILDREYEKVKSGNILTEEKNAADAASEEKFTAREPEDPMEAMFEAEGVIRGYEPKPIETDVLERIEAAEAEKRVREEAARLIEEEREKARLEAEAAQSAEETPAEPAVEEIPVAEVAETVEGVTEAAEPQVEVPVVEETPAVEKQEAAPAEEIFGGEVEKTEPVTEEPEKTKQVDKAAILAGMAVASEMVQRDRALAAEQAAEEVVEEAVEAVEEPKIELPDFLGHDEETAEEVPEIEIAEIVEEPETEAAAEEVAEEVTEQPEDVEVDIFEQLQGMEEEAPAEEIVLTDAQTIEDLFAELPDQTEEPVQMATEHTLILTEDSVAEILNASTSEPVVEEGTREDTMVFTAHTLGAILAEAEKSDPDAEEVVVSMEDLTAVANAVTEEAAAAEAEEEEQHESGGKGRVVLKIFLVILIILLALEVAGVVIKIAAPTSGAADFIDTQLHKLFQLVGDEESTVTALTDTIEANDTVYKI